MNWLFRWTASTFYGRNLICFVWRPRAYLTVNSLYLGYNLSVNVV
jgi:hypothetical protein